MITEENIIKIYVDAGFLYHKTGNKKYILSTPSWNLPNDQEVVDIQTALMKNKRTLTLTIEQMCIKLLENNLIEI